MAKSPTYCDPEILARLSSLALRARRVVEGTLSGMHKSPYFGANVEFAEHRQYVPGDDLRRLDWRVYGRTGRYFVKRYEQESNLAAMLLVDASRSMAYGSGPLNKFQCAATLAASIATLLVTQQDPVGLALFDTQSRAPLPPSATQAHLAQLIKDLEAAAPDRETELGTVLKQASETLGRRGLVLIFSDMLTDLEQAFDGISQLQFRGHEVLLFHILDSDELLLPFDSPICFKDLEGSEQIRAEPWAFRKAYQAAMQDFLRELKGKCGGQRVDYCLVQCQDDIGLALSHYLHQRGAIKR